MAKIIKPIEFDYSLMLKKDVNFTVYGDPMGKERPRMARRGNYVTTYTPKKTKEYEKIVKNSYIKSIGKVKLDNAIEVNITGVFRVPKSTSKKMKKEMLEGNIKHTKKPDCDNMGKIILDGLNKVAYDDDSQICKLNIEKMYGEKPMVKVNLKEI